jgi:ribosome-associated toxin RatA of RatAB toxin-antitoxin module
MDKPLRARHHACREPVARRRVFALWAVVAIGGLQSAGAAESLVVDVEREGALLRVHATLGADAPAQLCYEVLADFDHIEQFIPGMRTSDVISAAGEPIRLHQVGEASAGPFSFDIDVTLAVTERPPTRIEFHRIAGNLERMTGGWDVAGDASHCSIVYQADIDPAFWVPPLIGPRLMRNQVETQMRGLLAEIARRAARTPSAGARGS